MVLVAVGFVALLGAAGLAIDVGHMEVMQRQVQSAADASALAGALEITKCDGTTGCSAMSTAAKDAVTENGLTNSTLVTQCGSTAGDTLSVTVNNGPCAMGSSSADPHYLDSQYVEAVVRKVEPTIFANVLGIPSLTISARAEATVGNYPNCFIISAYQPTSKSNQLTLNGNDKLDMPTCGIMDNSDSSTALIANGNVTVTTNGITIHGGDIINGNTSVSPTPVTNAATQTDPLNWLNSDKPTPSGCTYNNELASTNTTLYAGTYCGGLTINSTVTASFQPGVYIMQGNMIVNGSDTISGTGLMFYFTSGSLIMNGNSHADLVAATTGTYAGILLYQDPSDTSTMTLNGDSTSVWQGAFYSPTGTLIVNGTGNLAAYTILDVASATLNGNVHLGSNYSSLPGGSPAKGVTAVLAE
jgi:Flp pilus assembly protein TadG